MSDHKGDPNKKPPECLIGQGGDTTSCKHLKEIHKTDMECETYSCELCGEYFKLYYGDMQ